MYVCMYTYMYNYAKICQYIYLYLSVNVCMNIRMYVCNACMYVLYAYIRVCMHLCVYACMYICMHVCIHVCIYVIFKLYVYMHVCIYCTSIECIIGVFIIVSHKITMNAFAWYKHYLYKCDVLSIKFLYTFILGPHIHCWLNIIRTCFYVIYMYINLIIYLLICIIQSEQCIYR